MNRVLTTAEVYTLAQKAVTALAYRYPALDRKQWAKTLTTLAWVESKYDTQAVNKSSTARGIMQILKGTREWLEQRLNIKTTSQDRLMADPAYSVFLAAEYIAWLYGRKGIGSWNRAIVAYHLGHYDASSKAGKDYAAAYSAADKTLDWSSVRVSSDVAAASKTRYYKEFP